MRTRNNWIDGGNNKDVSGSEDAKSERTPNQTKFKVGSLGASDYNNTNRITNQLSTGRNTVRPDGMIDETEVRYIRDSIAFNSFPNQNALSREEESNSYLYVAFPS